MLALLAFLLAAGPSPLAAEPKEAPPRPMLPCRSASIARSFGGQLWRIRACHNGSLLVEAAEGNPARPLQFMFWNNRDGTYRFVHQEGVVSEAVRPAVAELQALEPAAITALLREAQARR